MGVAGDRPPGGDLLALPALRYPGARLFLLDGSRAVLLVRQQDCRGGDTGRRIRRPFHLPPRRGGRSPDRQIDTLRARNQPALRRSPPLLRGRPCAHAPRGGGAVPVATAVLFAPLLVGLSRELYLEFALGALVAFQFFLWFRSERFSRPRINTLFAFTFALGMLFKMTWPLYFAGPMVIEAFLLIREKRARRLITFLLVTIVPAGAVLLALRLFFEHSFVYYIAMGNTRIPIMRLIGPEALFSLDSLVYYPLQLARSGLWFLTAGLVLPLFHLFARRGRSSPLRNREAAIVWAWLLFPMAVLLFQTVKEPRHIAPCIPAAILLIGMGLSAVRSRIARFSLSLGIVLTAAIQFGALALGLAASPYLLAAPTGAPAIQRAMIEQSPTARRFTSPSGRIDTGAWKYTLDVALSGFDSNQALSLAWRLAPGITINLDIEEWESGDGERPFRRFEDLFYFESLNMYNRRCNWDRPFHVFDRSEIMDRADFLLMKGGDHAKSVDDARFSLVKEIDPGDGRMVRIYARVDEKAGSLRELYAGKMLQRHGDLDAKELNTIYYSLFMGERIMGRIPERNELLRGFPDSFTPGMEKRNIYWLGYYGPLTNMVDREYRDHVAR